MCKTSNVICVQCHKSVIMMCACPHTVSAALSLLDFTTKQWLMNRFELVAEQHNGFMRVANVLMDNKNVCQE